jgi:AraC-like DNA-binding protein
MRRPPFPIMGVRIIADENAEHPSLSGLRKCTFPERSRLYWLSPRELGTLWQESLTSYLHRLAGHHHVSPRHLAEQEILPHLSIPFTRKHFTVFCWSSAMKINGIGQTADEWATTLERLTRWSDLHLLTVLPWMGDLASPRLLREKPAWCPDCYAEWKASKEPAYEPLIWMIHAMTICLKHRRRLEDRCPHCRKMQPTIRLRATIDVCTQCQTWLGLSAHMGEQVQPEILEQQIWVWRALEELRTAPTLFSWDRFFAHIRAVCTMPGQQSRLAELAGVARGHFAHWLHRSCTPTFENILDFCYVCNVSPVQVLTQDLASLQQALEAGKPFRPPRSRRPFRSVDHERCRQRIQAILDGHEEPLGYVQLAQQLGYTGQTLRYHFPQECLLLSQLVQEYRQQRKEQRLARIQDEVRQAVLSFHVQGIYPSQNKVSELLSDPNLLFQPEAKATWRILVRGLGWDRQQTATGFRN